MSELKHYHIGPGESYGYISQLFFDEPVVINDLQDFIKLKKDLDKLSDAYGRQLEKSMGKIEQPPRT